MRIAICDDDINQLSTIKVAINNYMTLHSEEIYEVECFDNPLEFLLRLEKIGGYDIILLDICMPGILGIDIAKEIRNKKQNSEIVFLTSSKDYAVEAFALKAAHYVVKPFTKKQLYEALDRAMEKFKNKQKKNINIKLRNGEMRFIDFDEILYVENFNHSQVVNLKNGEGLEARQTLSELSDIFNKGSREQFISPYRGFLVNQKSIRVIEREKIILKNGKEIPIVKRNYAIIKKQYFNFMFTREDD